MHFCESSLRTLLCCGRKLEGVVFNCSCSIRWIQLWQQRGEAGLHNQQLFCNNGVSKIPLQLMNISQCGMGHFLQSVVVMKRMVWVQYKLKGIFHPKITILSSVNIYSSSCHPNRHDFFFFCRTQMVKCCFGPH